MANKNLKRLERVSARLSEGSDDRTGRDAPTGPLSSFLGRQKSLRDLTQGQRREIVLLKVQPQRIRLWDERSRHYEVLNERRCADLVDSFRRTGQQEFPAVVRPLEGDPEHDYELIVGARRHWTASFLGWDLLVEVRTLSDKQAFTIQDLENRDREDISDVERARDYSRALGKYFDDNRTSLAQYLQMDRGNLSRLLDLAAMPDAIVRAYQDERELKVHHGMVYKKLLADSDGKAAVVVRAREIAEEGGLPGKKVLSELKGAPKSRQLRHRVVGDFISVNGVAKPVTVKADRAGDLILRVPREAVAKSEQLVEALEAWFQEHPKETE